MHSKICSICKKEFATSELKNKHALEHIATYYSCDFCKVTVRLKSSLLRHIKRKHSLEAKNVDPSKIVPHSSKKQTNSEHNLNQNSDTNTVCDYGAQNLSSEFENFNFDLNKSRNCESVLDFNDLEMELGADFGLQQNNEDILSMPNLGTEQDLNLGEYTCFF